MSLYTIFTLYRFKDMFSIIIVTPRPDQLTNNAILKEIETLMQDPTNKISLFLYDTTLKDGINNEQNKYYHFFSVYLGLEACVTPFCIKMRSDEFYSNLEPIMAAATQNKDKLVTTDVFFRNATMPIHPSDHLVAGKTSTMLETFKTAKLLCEKVNVPYVQELTKYILENTQRHVNTDKNWLAAEQLLGMGAMLSQISPSKLKEPKGIELMKELFYIVKVINLGLFRVMFNSHKDGPKEFHDETYFDNTTDIDDINDYGT